MSKVKKMQKRLAIAIGLGIFLVLLAWAIDKHQQSEVINSKLINANTQFSFKLFSEIIKQDSRKNVFVSPTSIAIALGMIYNGANNETHQAIAKVLELPDEIKSLNQANATLQAKLGSEKPGIKILLGNSLWVKNGIILEPKFVQEAQNFYHANVTNLDFTNKNAVNTINDWVKQSTNGKISKITQGIPNQPTALLINTIYFKGVWTNKFEHENTKSGFFTLNDGRKKPLNFMSQNRNYSYYENQQFQAISLPYGQEQFSMYIFLPKPNSSLEKFYPALNDKNWQEWLGGFSKQKGYIELPRFKLGYDLDLKKTLTTLGMGIAFDEKHADFSGMSKNKVFLDQAIHKTWIEVNEEGTEAAAVTSLRAIPSPANFSTFRMIIDRPFFCAIRDNQTGTIIFMGSIVEPEN